MLFWCYTVTFHREKRRLKILARDKRCDFRATRRRNKIPLLPNISPRREDIRLGIEITCLGAVRYRLNSITCFLFMRRFHSHGCYPHRSVSFFLFFPSTDPLCAWYRVTRSGLWPWKFPLFYSYGYHGRAHVLPMTTAPSPPESSMGSPFEEREKFSKAMTSFLFFFFFSRRGCGLVIRANRISPLLHHGASWCTGKSFSRMALKYISL